MSNEPFSLLLMEKAYQDLDEIYSYIAENLQAEQAANRLIDKIESSIVRLKDFPLAGSYVLDDLLKSKGYRKLVFDNFLALYLVDEPQHRVIIMRVIYGATNYFEHL